MPVFDNLNSLNAYISNVTTKYIAEESMKISKDLLNKAIDETVYKDTSPNSFYENTFGLRNNAMSFETKYGSGTSGILRNIDTIIIPDGRYESYYLANGMGNLDNSLYIIEWLNNGHKGYYKNVSINYGGKMFYELAYENLFKASFYKRSISNMLKTKGYVLTR